MDKNKLFESFNYLDDDLLQRAEPVKKKWSFNFWLKPALAFMTVVLAVVVINGLPRGGGMKAVEPDNDMQGIDAVNEETFEMSNEESGVITYVNDSTGLVTYVTLVSGEEHKDVGYETATSYVVEEERVNQVYVTINDKLYRVYNNADDYETGIRDINYVIENYLKNE
ncbi:MAG: hypothetical protein IJJ19_05460 [Erysipelotrichaceae bacterium]|nr:hypothetical protein [Erysipelotrichaceae bacterium]